MAHFQRSPFKGTRPAKWVLPPFNTPDKHMVTAHLSNRGSFWRSSSLLSGTLGNTTSCSTVTRHVLSSQYLQGKRAGMEDSVVHAAEFHTQEVPASRPLKDGRANRRGARRDDTKQRAAAASVPAEPHDVCRPPVICLKKVNTRRQRGTRSSTCFAHQPCRRGVRSLLGLQRNEWRSGRGLQSCHLPLSNVGKIKEVLGMQAPDGDRGARPEQALLLLRVDAQHAAALPGVRVLQARVGSRWIG